MPDASQQIPNPATSVCICDRRRPLDVLQGTELKVEPINVLGRMTRIRTRYKTPKETCVCVCGVLNEQIRTCL